MEKIHVWYEKGKPVYLHMFSKFKQVEFYDMNFEADAYIFKRKYSTLNLEIPSFDLQTSDRIIMDTVNVMRETTAQFYKDSTIYYYSGYKKPHAKSKIDPSVLGIAPVLNGNIGDLERKLSNDSSNQSNEYIELRIVSYRQTGVKMETFLELYIQKEKPLI